ncbi:unnamed protein product, partial [Ectocarpus fasciculatus]
SRRAVSETAHHVTSGDPLEILVIGDSSNPIISELDNLRPDARVIGVFNTASEAMAAPDKLEQLMHANTILNVSGNAESIRDFVPLMPSLSWVHAISAGLDHLWCEELLRDDNIRVSNTKGVFCDTLAEYVMGACLHFAKDIPQLLAQRQDKQWNRFYMSELRGSTMGIVGYGDIGRSCAKLAKSFGMKVSACRRRPELSSQDELVDNHFSPENIKELLSSSEYVVVCAPLTADTVDLIGASELASSKEGQVLINIGRGPIINEDALLASLRSGHRIRGCALDVFNQEPLPQSSELWSAPNVLLSPHNADFTIHSRRKSMRKFVALCDKVMNSESIIYADKQLRY